MTCEDDDDAEVFKKVVFEELMNKKRKFQECKLCEIHFDVINNLDHADFFNIFSSNIGKTDMNIIINDMLVYFKSKIDIENEFNLEKNDIKNHFFNCINEPIVEYYVQIQQYKLLRNMMLDNFVQTNKMDEALFDLKLFGTIDKINTNILKLYKEKPAEALFTSNELNQ
jgi:hypothetical protein